MEIAAKHEVPADEAARLRDLVLPIVRRWFDDHPHVFQESGESEHAKETDHES